MTSTDTSRPGMPAHAAMDQFAVCDGELQVGGARLSVLAARVGQTPFYAYDRGALRTRVAELREALPQAVRLHYAMKANPMPAVVGFMAPLVDGIDVASAGELKIALDAGADPREISFAGPGKRETELRQAITARVRPRKTAEETRNLENDFKGEKLGCGKRVQADAARDWAWRGGNAARTPHGGGGRRAWFGVGAGCAAGGRGVKPLLQSNQRRRVRRAAEARAPTRSG